MGLIKDIKDELEELISEGKMLLRDYIKNHKEGDAHKMNLHSRYHIWYSKAALVVEQTLPFRHKEFVSYFEPSSKRKELNVLSYTISDFILGITREDLSGKEAFDSFSVFITKFINQIGILESIMPVLDLKLKDISGVLQADLFDNELEAAKELLKKGHLRAAGALAGVTLERHLAHILDNHNLKLSKKKPSISDYNDALKNSGIYDVPNWRLIQRLGDIRNLCVHSKDREPIEDEVRELIDGVSKAIKTIF